MLIAGACAETPAAVNTAIGNSAEANALIPLEPTLNDDGTVNTDACITSVVSLNSAFTLECGSDRTDCTNATARRYKDALYEATRVCYPAILREANLYPICEYVEEDCLEQAERSVAPTDVAQATSIELEEAALDGFRACLIEDLHCSEDPSKPPEPQDSDLTDEQQTCLERQERSLNALLDCFGISESESEAELANVRSLEACEALNDAYNDVFDECDALFTNE